MAPSCRARHFVIVVLIAVGLNYTVFAPRRKRMTRCLLNLLSALSLLVCVAVCVLWIWSHARAYRATIVWPVRQGEVRSLLLYTGRGGVDFSFGHSAMVGERKLTPDGLRFRHHVEEHPVHAGQAKAEALKYRHTACGFGADAYATVMPFYEWHGDFSASFGRQIATLTVSSRRVWVPCWAVALALVVLPLRRLGHFARGRRGRYRGARGLCPSCGYDLRATPGQCPECGAPAKAPA